LQKEINHQPRTVQQVQPRGRTHTSIDHRHQVGFIHSRCLETTTTAAKHAADTREEGNMSNIKKTTWHRKLKPNIKSVG
jgi:hypothetical protein